MKAGFDGSVKNCSMFIELEKYDELAKLAEALSMHVRIYNDSQMEKLLEIVWECLEHLESEISI